MRVGGLEIDETTLEVRYGDRRVRMGPKPFELLIHLARNAPQTIGKQELAAALWSDQEVTNWALTSTVRQVRRALRAVGAMDTIRVQPVWGQGYRLAVPSPAGAPNEAGAGAPRETPPLVGRGDEVERLLRVASGGLAGGRTRTIVVSGAAGIGKSRLVAHVGALLATHGIDVLWGRCHEGEEQPFWPWAEIVGTYCLSQGAEQVRALMGPLAPELGRVLPSVRALCDVDRPPADDPAAARLGLFDALFNLLDRIAARRPCVLVVDDLQWADSSSLLLLGALASRRSTVPLLVVAIHRTEDLDAGHLAASRPAPLPPGDAIERLVLGPLSAEDSRALLKTLGAADDRDERATEIVRLAGGNPLVLEELYRHRDARPGDARFPPRVESLVLRRLERHPPAYRRVVAWAAAFGTAFRADLLREVAEQDGPIVDEVLDALVADGLLVPPSGAGESHRFADALTYAVVHGATPAAERTAFERAIAERLAADPVRATRPAP